MKTTSHSASGEPAANREVAYEARDVNVATILRVGVALVLTVVAAAAIVWGTFGWLEKREARLEPARSPLLGDAPRPLPPEPRLQGAPGHETPPAEELKQMQDAAEAILNSYGWVDEKAGVARIPVREAMKLAARDLPIASSGGAADESGRGARESSGRRESPKASKKP